MAIRGLSREERKFCFVQSRDYYIQYRCLIIGTFLFVIVAMVVTATLLAVFLSPRDVTLVCSSVYVTNWSNIVPSQHDSLSARQKHHMTLQVIDW